MTPKRIAMAGVGADSRRRRVIAAAAVVVLLAGVAVAVPRALDRAPFPPQVLDAMHSTTPTASPSPPPPAVTPDAALDVSPTPSTDDGTSAHATPTDEQPPSEAIEPSLDPAATPDPVVGTSPRPAQPSDPPGDFWDAFTVTVITDASSYRPGVDVQVTTTVCNVSEYEQWVSRGDFVHHEYRRLDGPTTHGAWTGHVDYFDNTGPFSWPVGRCRAFDETWNHTYSGAASGTYHVMASWDGVGAEGATETALSEPFRLLPEEGEPFIQETNDARFETTVTADADRYATTDEVKLTLTTCNVTGEAIEAHSATMFHEVRISDPNNSTNEAVREFEDASDEGGADQPWASGECRAFSSTWSGGDDRWSWRGRDRAPERLPDGDFQARGETVFVEDTAHDEQTWWHSSTRTPADSDFRVTEAS